MYVPINRLSSKLYQTQMYAWLVTEMDGHSDLRFFFLFIGSESLHRAHILI